MNILVFIIVGFLVLFAVFLAYYLGHYIGYTDCEKDNKYGTNHRWWESIIDKFL